VGPAPAPRVAAVSAPGVAVVPGAVPSAPSDRTVTIRSPIETVPPLAIWIFSITPPTVDGTSIVAFSVSSVTSGASGSIFSPGLTSTSMMATSLKLPISGTRTSTRPAAAFMAIALSVFPGNRLRGIDAELLHRSDHGSVVHLALVRERIQRRDRDVVAINLEMSAQRGA